MILQYVLGYLGYWLTWLTFPVLKPHLVMPHFLLAVHDDGGSLGGVAIFVRIGGNAGDAGQPEIEERQRKSGFFHKGNQESAETSVNVNGNATTKAQSGDGRDGVHGA